MISAIQTAPHGSGWRSGGFRSFLVATGLPLPGLLAIGVVRTVEGQWSSWAVVIYVLLWIGIISNGVWTAASVGRSRGRVRARTFVPGLVWGIASALVLLVGQLS